MEQRFFWGKIIYKQISLNLILEQQKTKNTTDSQENHEKLEGTYKIDKKFSNGKNKNFS